MKQLDAEQLRRTLRRLSHEILERTADLSELVFIGIRTRGVPLAERLAGELQSLVGVRPLVGALDVTLYRDDLNQGGGVRTGLKKTDLPFSCEGKDVVLVDDVLYTGRTARGRSGRARQLRPAPQGAARHSGGQGRAGTAHSRRFRGEKHRSGPSRGGAGASGGNRRPGRRFQTIIEAGTLSVGGMI